MTNVKSQLRSYRAAVHEVRDITERIICVRSQAERVTAALTGMPGGGLRDDNIQSCVALLDELERRYVERLRETIRLLTAIEDGIDALPDERHRQVLRMRYIDGLGWEEIAERMGYTKRQITNIHGSALAAFSAKDFPKFP